MERYNDILDANQQAKDAYQPNYASFWERLGASIIDSIVLSIPMYLIFFLIALNMDFNDPESFEDSSFLATLVGLYVVMFAASMLYPALMEASRYRATLGKMALKLQVNNKDGGKISVGQAFGRNVGKIISALPLYIGLIMPLWDRERQALHDKLAKTWVVRR